MGYLIGLGALLVLCGGILAFVMTRPASARPDVLTHTVKRESLTVTVSEKGTLESADNLDIVCKVKAGQKGFASTINWVIPDGSRVNAGDRLMILDDSALQEQLQTQQIVVDTTEAAKVKAEEDLAIVLKKNESDLAAARTAVILAQIELEKYLGLAFDDDDTPLAAIVGVPAALSESGEYRQKFDDLTGQLRLAESEVGQNSERAAWANNQVKKKYMSPAQAQAEKSRLDSSIEKLRSLQFQRKLLEGYERKKMLTDLTSKLDLAERTLDQKIKETHSLQVQAESEQKHKLSVYLQGVDKYEELKKQIELCKIKAPRDGMVVYYKQESNRFMSNSQGLIEQGQPVKEGQKLLRIPNLDVMQVNTKVHEAMVDRIKEDQRVPTFMLDWIRGGNAMQSNPFGRLVAQREEYQDALRDTIKEKEFKTVSLGQRATVRIDALGPDRVLPARVKSVAAVASQAEAWVSDVKMFPTVVLIEGKVARLKPDMSAEVTIHIDGVNDVLCIPLQAVFTESDAAGAPKRKVYVKTAAGNYDKRDIVLGIFNQKMIEVKSGIDEGDEVVINPKVLLDDGKGKPGEGQGQGGENKGGSDKGMYQPADKGGFQGGDKTGGQKQGPGGKKKDGPQPADAGKQG